MEWYYYALIFLIGFIPVTWYFFKLGAFSTPEPEAVSDDETVPQGFSKMVIYYKNDEIK